MFFVFVLKFNLLGVLDWISYKFLLMTMGGSLLFHLFEPEIVHLQFAMANGHRTNSVRRDGSQGDKDKRLMKKIVSPTSEWGQDSTAL
jgi:hypothetical protein